MRARNNEKQLELHLVGAELAVFREDKNCRSFLAPHCPHYEERDSGAMQVSKEKQLEFNLAVLKRRDQGITNVRGWP